MAMTTREFMMHLLMNCEMDDPVHIEVRVPDNNSYKYLRFEPTHACHLGEFDDPETLIETKYLEE